MDGLMDYQEMKEKWDFTKSHYGDLYDRCEEDWQFLHGIGQWSDNDIKARKRGAKPYLTLNQLLPYAQQIVNDIRQARIGVRVSPVDDSGDIDTAEVMQGIIRNIERQSDANTAYHTAALNAVGSGIGWLRLRTDYADNKSFDQEIYIERVPDFTSVFLEPNFERIDGSDSEYGFVLDKLTTDRYEALYPDRDPLSFDDTRTNDDEVCIAEAYCKEYTNDTLYQILVGGEIDVINQERIDLLEENNANGGDFVDYEIKAERKIKVPTIYKAILDGHDEEIEKEEFPSQYIPLIPVFGQEVYMDGQREFHSLIRQAKDAQKMYNYYNSESAYIMALQPKTPWTAPVGSFDSFPNKWVNANKEPFSFLEYDIVYDKNGNPMPPPSRQPAPQGSPEIMQSGMMAKEDIRLAIGMPQANMGETSSEISGVAIRNRQVEGDNATYHFIDNLSAGISHVGRIIVDMIPRVYSERTLMRIIGEDGEEKNVPVNTPYVKQDGNVVPAKGLEATGIYDLSAGKYDVVCDVGASYSSKRQETADKLIQLINAKPELGDITGDLLFEALDLPMSKEIAERIKSTLDPALLGDDPQASKLQQAAKALKQMEEQVLNYQAALDDKKKNEEFEQNYKLKELENERLKISDDMRMTSAKIAQMQAETQGMANQNAAQIFSGITQLAERLEEHGAVLETMLDAKEAELAEAEAEAETVALDTDQEEEPQD